MEFARILRLAVDAGLAAVIPETGGGDLAAGVAVNAGGIDEEVAGGVLGQAVVELRHLLFDSPLGCGVA